MNSSSALPVAKVTTTLLAGAITTIIVWVLETYAGVEIPVEVAAGATTLIGFVVGYLTPPMQSDITTNKQ